MKSKRMLAAGALAALAGLAGLTACGGGAAPGKEPVVAPSDPADVSGAITVLTNRTDLQADGTLEKYAQEFEKVYPDVSVKFEAITNYEDEVKIRLNTDKYGDVLLIPSNVAHQDYPSFFSPLGDESDLEAKYRFIPNASVDGTAYGLATFGNTTGFVYNTDVWAKAGITDWPTTPQELLEDLAAIKDKTDATPYYTNYHDAWPLTQFQSALGSVSCDPQANNDLASTEKPWADGTELRTIDTLLYDIVKDGYAEDDPTTTNWEQSKSMLAKGRIGSMFLGSWAITQMQDAAKAAGVDPSVIGFMPFPAQTDGKFCAVVAPDYQQAISVHSDHKEAARAWIDWFTDKSGFADAEGAISTAKDAPLPDTLAAFEQQGVKFIELDQSKATLVNTIDKDAEVGLTAPDYRQSIVDSARGAGGQSLEDIFSSLDEKWASAEQSAG